MDHLQTEASNPASRRLDDMSAIEIAHLMNSEDSLVAAAVGSQLTLVAQAIDAVAERLQRGGRLIYVGAGTSGRLGVLDASECPPTFQSRPEQVVGVIAGGSIALTQAVEGAEDRADDAARDLTHLGIGPNDAVLGIATSGRTPYVLAAIDLARRAGACTIGFSCNADSNLASVVDISIAPIVGPEVLSGSTRLKAGTATKLVLNMITTGAMVRLGKTYGNLMVDLKATNVKLKARANRIVRSITGLASEPAAELLQRCEGEVKTALVVHESGVTPARARELLADVGGSVRRALRSAAPPRPAIMHADLVIGVDGGGSHTVALLADRTGRIVGRGQGGPSNIQAVGEARGTAAIDDAVDRAFQSAGLQRGAVSAAMLGLAGVDRVEAADMIRRWADRVCLAERLRIDNDATLLLAAGTPAGWGVAVIAGTGSIAFGRAADGRFDRSGGWGYLMGDEGSAFAIALNGVRAVARSADGCGPPTSLTRKILAAMELTDPLQMIQAVYLGAWDRARLASLAPIVLAEAEGGDVVAGTIVQHEADEIARTTAAVIDKMKLPRAGVPLAATGGTLLNNPGYRAMYLNSLQALGVRPDPVTLVDDPALGAVRLARQLLTEPAA